MEKIEAQIHRTLVQYLIECNHKELAAMLVDGGVEQLINMDGYAYRAYIDLPPAAYNFIFADESLSEALILCMRNVMKGRYAYPDIDIEIRMKLLELENNWEEIIKNLLAEAQSPNQGAITAKMFSRDGKPYFEYNQVKYASKSEIRIAQEFERRKVLFFPLALGIRNDTGIHYADHREIDFLICNDGVWGILEVSYHPDRYEKDSEKTVWFKKSGILCVEHYTAERCYNRPAEVVKEFLEILGKHKR